MPPLILVIDDDAALTALLRLLLEEAGYLVVSAVNEAALTLAAEPPALVLLDMVMPEMDGLEVTWRLRADPRTCNVPIVLMSSTSGLHERARGAAVDALLPKPFHIDDALAVVEHLAGPPWQRGGAGGVRAVTTRA